MSLVAPIYPDPHTHVRLHLSPNRGPRPTFSTTAAATAIHVHHHHNTTIISIVSPTIPTETITSDVPSPPKPPPKGCETTLGVFVGAQASTMGAGGGGRPTTHEDANHAGCINIRKSTSRGIQFLGDKLVSWMSKKQDYTAMSSAKAGLYGGGGIPVQLKSDSLPHAHAQTIKTYYKHQDSRIKKAQDSKTKTSANSYVQDLPSRYQVYQGRLLARFLDDVKYEHVGQDIRSQGGKDDQD
ncbi:hypothetical protein Tco_1113361 [Tanacetum coccineum]|uniref:Uncharacterized protein n=1 Tax=Tanacetum coccineum TaxID=301880 RepID=A0ABQ5IRX5_9ASTR